MLVAVYGTLKQGRSNHALMRDSELLGEEVLNGFIMYRAGGFPVIYRDINHSIHIEVYEVHPDVVKHNLDPLEGHPHWYRREQVETNVGRAWIYIMQGDQYRVENRLILSGEF